MSAATATTAGAPDADAARPPRRVPRFRIRTLVALAVLAIAALVAVLANVLAPKDPAQAVVVDALLGPSWSSSPIIGTDQIGRDLLSRLLFGLRTSLMVGFLAVLVSASIGITLGMMAGYAGSIAEWVIMRLVDFQMSVPGILLVLVLAFVIGPGLGTTIIVLGIGGWVQYARMSRAEIRVVSQQQYILAARSVGVGTLRIALRHTFPNIANTLVVLAVLQFGQAIILEASISFLGFGVQSPNTSLGLMVKDGRDFMAIAWWMLVFPAAAIFILVLAINIVGDSLQDWFDPVRRRR
ncbi:MAG: ABC transporter permease [Dehalococcoidia bacterium]|nr:ABC transporter permease [Dehalococcoidia bacterium]